VKYPIYKEQQVKKISINLIIAISLLSIFSSSAVAAQSGLLLGLRFQEKMKDQFITRYRTLWIDASSGKVVVREAPYLIIPRNDGFWRLFNNYLYPHNSVQEQLFVHNVDKPLYIPRFDAEEYADCETKETFTILFVGNDYLSLETDSGGFCKGNAHPFESHSLSVLPISDLTAKPVEISRLIEKPIANMFKRSASAYIVRLNPTKRKRLASKADQASWGLIRSAGHWKLRGRFGPSGQATRGAFADFDIVMDPPPSLIGHDLLPLSWNEIKDKVNNAIDAFASPKKDLIVILTRKELFVYLINNGKIGKRLYKKALAKSESAVMAQWAVGRHVARWTMEFNRIQVLFQ
jgi:hypothetical protein